MAQLSPMMTHYLETKKEYPDCILFYRLGDFYEMFFEDARTVSRDRVLHFIYYAVQFPRRSVLWSNSV